ncbi:alpha/beta hydrolase family protein [Pedobacter aquatilis]|uniref:alpha/beta hydrolase family protein n=1 Tax=Pedobacter aquatilis TaxID=351343 RepID=UPI00292EF7A7|nr:alpha/beta fold hydrolase [Pedobacter aquatilis]
MKKLICFFIGVAMSNLLYAQNLTGSWYGILEIPGGKLRVNFHIKAEGTAFVSTMDSPDQGAKGIPTDKTTIQGNEISIEAAKLGLVYKANYDAQHDELKGTFTQGPGSLPLKLSRKEQGVEKVVVNRPQEPSDFPYDQQEVTFQNRAAGHELSGTLSLPRGGKANKIVVMISGSGPQDRNEEVAQFKHKPFLVWSDYLTRRGIAVLRYDDRGVGKSGGKFSGATTADFASDVQAAVEFIKSRPDLKSLKIGLIGHSEGGMIAPMVASENPAVHFIVLLAGPGIPIWELMVQQGKDQMLISGLPDSAVAMNSALNRKIYAAAVQYKDLNAVDFKVKLDTVLTEAFHKNMDDGDAEVVVSERVKSTLKQLSDPWFRYFISFDPQVYLQKVKCPVLAINGTLDMQVASVSNLAGIRASLSKAANKHFEIVPIKNLNHLLQLAKTGSMAEYGQIEETVNPQALEKVGAWIVQL